MSDISVGIFVNTAIILMANNFSFSFIRDQYYYKYTSKKGKWVLAFNILIIMGAIIWFTYQFNYRWWITNV